MFVPRKPFQPSLMFVWPDSTSRVGSWPYPHTLDWLETFARGTQSSLLEAFVNYWRKKFYNAQISQKSRTKTHFKGNLHVKFRNAILLSFSLQKRNKSRYLSPISAESDSEIACVNGSLLEVSFQLFYLVNISQKNLCAIVNSFWLKKINFIFY